MMLSKLISTRWKELSEGRKDFYREVASCDLKCCRDYSLPNGKAPRNAITFKGIARS